ncbi:glycoside hydrolase family 15 protein [Patescibacteria group bacterium]|nr:glycoside hydrolase family 15 protein [Patescibacteria group bacterium]
MPKALTLGNGRVLICLDKFGQVRDLYFHYAGLENHVSEKMVHKIGVWVDDRLTWIDDGMWEVSVDCEKGTMASVISAKNESSGITLRFSDVVYNEKNIFLREVTVKNLYGRTRKLKIYFNQQFNISQTHTGDTAYFDPIDRVVIHYKGRRAFLINVKEKDTSFGEYSVGLLRMEGKEGTFKDAEDGELTANPIEHGQVDSVIGIEIELAPQKSKKFHYWMTIGKSIARIKKLNDYVLTKTPAYLVKSTKDYWDAWIHNQRFTFFGLTDPIVDLFNKSLVTIRTHVSYNGSIIASGDSDMLQYGRDTYSYHWPRDAAISAIALARAGDFNSSKLFFEFCNDVISPQGYFMHKYKPDKSLGSSWHPWIRDGKPVLPIQEDATALVIYALWTHFELSRDLEFIETIYNTLIKSAAEFMSNFRDKKTGLPSPSYDLWEMKFGVSTFTAASVYGALTVAGKFASLLGKKKSAASYYQAAVEIKQGIFNHLYNEKDGTFYKLINIKDGKVMKDVTIDISSAYGVYKFGVLEYDDPKLKRAMEESVVRLGLKTKVGGIARFEGDLYHSQGGNVPGNPWFITTLWYTQYLTEFVKKKGDIADIVARFAWVVERALPSGILSEQLNPHSGEQVSAAPLIWSHAEFVISVIQYLEKLKELGISEVRNTKDK